MGKKTYSVLPADYKLREEVGYGASATVYRAIYVPTGEVVAVKCLDLDRCNSNLDDIRREAQTMSLIDHPNVIKAHCSFVVEHCLWVIMPFMAEGSCLHLMKIAYPDGFEEPVIASMLKETLKALDYLHRHGHIHRDVKAGNILLDTGGVIKLGDFGVSACMFDRGDRQRSRNTFVGTPCWMAPEVLQPGSGYNFKADIWSLGITALELAHGHAPFSKYPPMKVLLMTIQNAPPGLDYDRDKKFSKSFKEVVAMCLVKDQTKRPTAEKLLKHSFFKNAKSPEISVKKILANLPPLWDRVKELQDKDAAQLALKKMPSAEQEALSQSEYQRGVSAWNFDIEDLKSQASLIQDDEDLLEKEEYGNSRSLTEKEPSGSRMVEGISIPEGNYGCRNGPGRLNSMEDEIVEVDHADPSFQGTFDTDERGKMENSSTSMSRKEKEPVQLKAELVRKNSGLMVSASILNNSTSDKGHLSDRFDCENSVAADRYKRDSRKVPNFSGPLMLPNRASANSLSAPTPPVRSSGGYRDALEEKPKGNVVQIKGRFSVTSENVDLVKDIPICSVPRRASQGSPLRKSASVGDWLEPKQVSTLLATKDICNSMLPASILVPHLQNLFQQTSLQKDLIMNLLNSLQQAEQPDGASSQPSNPEDEMPVEAVVSEREQLLLVRISEMQSRISSLTDELTAAKVKHMQLQQELSAAYSREEERKKENKES